jgi:hypothetical protein
VLSATISDLRMEEEIVMLNIGDDDDDNDNKIVTEYM